MEYIVNLHKNRHCTYIAYSSDPWGFCVNSFVGIEVTIKFTFFYYNFSVEIWLKVAPKFTKQPRVANRFILFFLDILVFFRFKTSKSNNVLIFFYFKYRFDVQVPMENLWIFFSYIKPYLSYGWKIENVSHFVDFFFELFYCYIAFIRKWLIIS